MLNIAKLHHMLLFLLLGGIVSFSACNSCRNTSQGHKSPEGTTSKNLSYKHLELGLHGQPQLPLDKQTQLMNKIGPSQINTANLMKLIEREKISPTAKDGQGRNIVQNVIYHGTTPEELESVLQKLQEQFPNKNVAKQEIAKLLNTPDHSTTPQTAFMYAVESAGQQRNDNKKFLGLVDVLLQNGVKPSQEEQKRGLLYCVRLSCLETSETSVGMDFFEDLAKNFQTNDLPLDEATALAVASAVARAGNDDLMKYILEHPDTFPVSAASKDKQGNTLLHYAASGNKNGEHVMKVLLANLNSPFDNYINETNEEGKTALHIAIQKGEVPNNVRALIKAGANIHLKTKNEPTPLELAKGLLEKEPTNNYRAAIIRFLQPPSARTNSVD